MVDYLSEPEEQERRILTGRPEVMDLRPNRGGDRQCKLPLSFLYLIERGPRQADVQRGEQMTGQVVLE